MTESEQKWIETNNSACAVLRQLHDMLALSSLPPRRTGVGLTDEDRYEFAAAQYGWEDLLIAAEAKLKEKNNG